MAAVKKPRVAEDLSLVQTFGSFQGDELLPEMVDPQELGSEVELSQSGLDLMPKANEERLRKLERRTLCTACDLGAVYVPQPSAFYKMNDIIQEAMVVPNPTQRVEVLNSTIPGEYELLLDPHDAYLAAKTIGIRTDESMAALTKMSQLFGRVENSVPSTTPTFSRQISQMNSAGMTPQRIIDRCAALMCMLIRIRGDVGFEAKLSFVSSGTPVIQRPGSWQEFLNLVDLEATGKVIFPGVLLEETVANPISVLEVWSLLLSRSVRLEEGGTPYLVCWPPLVPAGECVNIAVRLHSFGVAAEISIVSLWDSITAFLDVFDLTPVFTSRLRFFLALQSEIFDGSGNVVYAPFETVKLAKFTAPFRTVTMAFCYFCRFSRKVVTNCFSRAELQRVLVETFLAGASLVLGVRVAVSSRFDILMRRYIKIAEERMATSFVDRTVREFIMKNFHKVESGIRFWRLVQGTLQSMGCTGNLGVHFARLVIDSDITVMVDAVLRWKIPTLMFHQVGLKVPYFSALCTLGRMQPTLTNELIELSRNGTWQESLSGSSDMLMQALLQWKMLVLLDVANETPALFMARRSVELVTEQVPRYFRMDLLSQEESIADFFEGGVIPGVSTRVQVRVASATDPVYTMYSRVDKHVSEIRFVESNLRVAQPSGVSASGIFVHSRGGVSTRKVPSFSITALAPSLDQPFVGQAEANNAAMDDWYRRASPIMPVGSIFK